MNCPNCGAEDWMQQFVARDMHLECMSCGWKTPGMTEMAETSPEYRLAKLKAAKAEPGWYGPDGRKWQVTIGLRTGEAYLVRGPDESEDIEYARLCGFVEVRYE